MMTESAISPSVSQQAIIYENNTDEESLAGAVRQTYKVENSSPLRGGKHQKCRDENLQGYGGTVGTVHHR